MLFRTHLALALLVALLSLSLSQEPLLHVAIVLLATMLPDIDSVHSRVGRFILLRPLQWLTKHRGVMHGALACLGLSVLVASLAEQAAVPFLLGYATHLASDAVTKEGVPLLWPARFRVRGFLRTGGVSEHIIFGIVCAADAVLLRRVVF